MITETNTGIGVDKHTHIRNCFFYLSIHLILKFQYLEKGAMTYTYIIRLKYLTRTDIAFKHNSVVSTSGDINVVDSHMTARNNLREGERQPGKETERDREIETI